MAKQIFVNLPVTEKNIADTTKTIEAIMVVSVKSRKKVNELAKKSVEAGGKIHREPQDVQAEYRRPRRPPLGVSLHR